MSDFFKTPAARAAIFTGVAIPITFDGEEAVAVQNVRVIYEWIDAPAERVYAFVADPGNLPLWAPNFGHTITRAGQDWVMETAEGPVSVRFVRPNDLGVLDHWVRLPDGTEAYNPIRVVAHGTGSVITFTLSRQSGFSDDEFAADAGLVAADLARLKGIMEGTLRLPTP